jgi:hypothetical protein
MQLIFSQDLMKVSLKKNKKWFTTKTKIYHWYNYY